MSMLKTQKAIEKWFEKEIPKLYTSRRVQIVTLRETISPCIFRTDVEGLDTLPTIAGFENREIISRSVIFKRKLVASERRTGKQLLRSMFERVPKTVWKKESGKEKQIERKPESKEEECYLNQNLCGRCIDCTLFGFTRPEGLVRKSRVEYDVAYSIRPYENIYETFNWNAIQEDTQTPGQAFGEIEVIRPGVIYPTVTTLHSITYDEFIYYLWCLLNTTSYGAVTSRTGKVKNAIVGLIFANAEVLTNLELTMAFYDRLKKNDDGKKQSEKKMLESSVISIEDVQSLADDVISSLVNNANTKVEHMKLQEVQNLLKDFKDSYVNKEEEFKKLVRDLEEECEKR